MAATGEAAPASRSAESLDALYDKLRPGPGMTAGEVASHQRTRIHGAVIEIVGERGYGEVTAREVASLAGVSTRAVYSHFQDKREFVLRTYEMVVQRAATRIVAAQNGERDWSERTRRVFEAFAEEVAHKPQEARLVLVEPYSIGPAALRRVRRTDNLIEAAVAEGLACAPVPAKMSPLVVKGMVAGVSRVARARLLCGRESEMSGLAGQLRDWALSFNDVAVGELASLDRWPSREGLRLPPKPTRSDKQAREDDRTLILTAVAKLTVSDSYDQLTVPRIRSAAGVSRRNFDSYFDGVEDCFLAALEQRVIAAIDIASAHTSGADWACDVDTMITRLCVGIAADPLLSKLAFAEAFAPGLAGLRCRESIITKIAKAFAAEAPLGQVHDALMAEASVAAIWAVLDQCIGSRGTRELPRAAPTLSYLALAPAIGASAAIEAIRDWRERP